MEPYLLEKSVWTEEEFSRMCWHDSRVYAIALAGGNDEFSLDIDYLCEWVCPTPEQLAKEDRSISFWIAPCTLIFEHVRELKFDLLVSSWMNLEILDVRRTNPRRPIYAKYFRRKTEYDWTVEMQQGMISFIANGYRQYARRKPVFSSSQTIDWEERGGISFSTELE